MAGKLFKADLLYRGSVWIRHFPDLTCIRTLGPYLVGRRRDARDDSLLMAITDAYAKSGIEICAGNRFCTGATCEPRTPRRPQAERATAT